MGFGYAACANALTQRIVGQRFAWFGFILMIVGSLGALIPELLGKSATLYTFYAPLIGNTWYYIGLLLVIIGSWIWVAVMLANLTRLENKKPRCCPYHWRCLPPAQVRCSGSGRRSESPSSF